MAELVILREAIKQAEELPANIIARVERIVDRLRRWPDVSGAKPLRGALAGHWRVRTGAYRVQFYIRHGRPASRDAAAVPDTVVVEKIGHRDRFYDE